MLASQRPEEDADRAVRIARLVSQLDELPRSKKDETLVIRATSMFTNASQEGLVGPKSVQNYLDARRRKWFDEMFCPAGSLGVSDVLLARGADVAAAIESTSWVHTGCQPADLLLVE